MPRSTTVEVIAAWIARRAEVERPRAAQRYRRVFSRPNVGNAGALA